MSIENIFQEISLTTAIGLMILECFLLIYVMWDSVKYVICIFVTSFILGLVLKLIWGIINA